MSAPAKRGRPPRDPVDVLRTKVWFASLKAISRLPSAYAIETAVCFPNSRGRPGSGPRPRKFAAYAKGQCVPQRKGDGSGIVDLAEAHFPGSAAVFDSPVWHLLNGELVDRAWIYSALRSLPFVSRTLVGSRGELMHPSQYFEGLAGLLSDHPASMQTLAVTMLFWRLAETIADKELQKRVPPANLHELTI